MADWLEPFRVAWVRADESGFLVDDGETVRRVAIADGVVSIRRTVRGEDRGIEVASPVATDIDRYLTVILGDGIRARLGLGCLENPGADRRVAPGFALDDDAVGYTALVDTRSGMRRVFVSATQASKFSYYAEADPYELEHPVPHAFEPGSELWRIELDGSEVLVGVFNAMGWVRVVQ
ncbi:Imm61 family immunity protein [Agromyces sp. MMS24-JH15]|uniref:Imm61 family immunity protein n=1 Tax=Agromyces sp. MMS24-JH15 TaxID=3243765 RepID=UPI00374884B4